MRTRLGYQRRGLYLNGTAALVVSGLIASEIERGKRSFIHVPRRVRNGNEAACVYKPGWSHDVVVMKSRVVDEWSRKRKMIAVERCVIRVTEIKRQELEERPVWLLLFLLDQDPIRLLSKGGAYTRDPQQASSLIEPEGVDAQTVDRYVLEARQGDVARHTDRRKAWEDQQAGMRVNELLSSALGDRDKARLMNTIRGLERKLEQITHQAA